jgi:hypothetical protein
MTISYTSNVKAYIGDSVTTAFATVMPFFANAHIGVTLQLGAGAIVPQVYGVDYSLTGAGANSGGTVSMTVAPPTGSTLTITRIVPLTQLTDYVAYDAFPADATEDALDLLTMIAQQMETQITGIASGGGGGGGGGMGATNIGGGGVGVYASTVSGVLQFKKLIGGLNVALVDSGSDITIQVNAPGVSYPGSVNTFLRGDGTWTSALGNDTSQLAGLELHAGGVAGIAYPSLLSIYNASGTAGGKWWSFWPDVGGSDDLHFSAWDDGGPYLGNPPMFDVLTVRRVGGSIARLDLGGGPTVGGGAETAFAFGPRASANAAAASNAPGLYMCGDISMAADPSSTIGPRIYADLGNNTIKKRMAFQSSVPNGASGIQVIPNGTGVVAAVICFNKSDPDNAGLTLLNAGGGIPTLRTVAIGTGVAEDLTIAIDGNVLVALKRSNLHLILGGSTAADDGVNGVQVAAGKDFNINSGVLKMANVKVLGARDTGWAPMTGTPNKASIYDTSSVTLPQLAGRVAQLQATLTAHGITGP